MSGKHATLIALMLVSSLFAFGNGIVPWAAAIGKLFFFTWFWLILFDLVISPVADWAFRAR